MSFHTASGTNWSGKLSRFSFNVAFSKYGNKCRMFAGKSSKCGIFRTIAGRLTAMKAIVVIYSTHHQFNSLQKVKLNQKSSVCVICMKYF